MTRVLRGEATERRPLWMMRQAGRYLPEYRALRTEARDFLAFCLNPEMASEASLQPLRRFGFDGAILFADILLIPWALGVPLHFEEGRGPVLQPVQSVESLQALRGADAVLEALEPVCQTLRLLAPQVKDATLIGFAGAPWTVATYVVEGHGSPDQAAAKLWAYRDPQGFARLIDLLTDATSLYLIAQAEAGAEALQIFESWAQGLPESVFAQWCIEPTARIVSRVKARFPSLPIIGFPRGCGSLLQDYVRGTGVDAVGLDTAQSIAQARGQVPGHVAMQGNLDPLALIAGGEALDVEVARILRGFTGAPHVFNLGHGILPQTPIAHVERLVELVRNGTR